jgi:hypothetical protein
MNAKWPTHAVEDPLDVIRVVTIELLVLWPLHNLARNVSGVWVWT